MLHNLKKRNEGFTIIEVMIVLAIAGLIMLVVFLAVPALQRNSRNTQRTADATRVTGAVDECLNNKNGKVASCDAFAAGELQDYVAIADNQQLTAENATESTTAFDLEFAMKCNDTGDGTVAASGRSFTVMYQVETRTGVANRCVGS